MYLKNLMRMEELKKIDERNKTDTARILHRIDNLSKQLNLNVSNVDLKTNVFTLKQHSEIKSEIDEMKDEKSYSQYREDLVFLSIFNEIGIDKPSYIDIGAHHPTKLSNTALLYERGSTGVNVEANPMLIDAFISQRTKDVNLNCGVGAHEGILEFTTIKNSPALSTFDSAQVQKLKGMGKRIERVIDVDVVELESIIEQYCNGVFPDFLTLDVEGGDFDILNSINFAKYRPKLICVEINSHDRLIRNADIDFLLFRCGYFHYGDIGGGIEGRNSLFIDKVFLECF